MFPSERWTIVEPLLARDERQVIAVAIDAHRGNVMTIGELHWSLSTVRLFLQQHQKIYRLFLIRC